jgi:PAS domain S-box-containing protein
VLKPPEAGLARGEMGQTIGRDEVSTVLSTIGSGESELSKRIWDKVLLENTDDVVHVLSLKGLFLYLSPASRKVLEYDASELVGTALSSVCHPSDIVPVTRELKDTSGGATVNVMFRIRRKHSGYTWFESHGCLHIEQGKGRKCIIMVGRERPVYAISRSQVVGVGGIGDSELWTKMSTSGMFLFVSSNSRALLDRSPPELVGTSIQAMMRSDSKKEFSRVLELARTGKKATTFKHEMQNRRGQVLQAQTTIYPGDAEEGSKPTFLVAQTRFVKMPRSTMLVSRPSVALSPRTDQASVGSVASSANQSGANSTGQAPSRPSITPQSSDSQLYHYEGNDAGAGAGGTGLCIGTQDEALASEDNIFDELKTTRSTSWQFELRQMEKQNRILIEEMQGLLSRRKKRKRRKGFCQMERDCANCHARVTPEWRRGPSGRRDLCNSCGLRWAKQVRLDHLVLSVWYLRPFFPDFRFTEWPRVASQDLGRSDRQTFQLTTTAITTPERRSQETPAWGNQWRVGRSGRGSGIWKRSREECRRSRRSRSSSSIRGGRRRRTSSNHDPRHDADAQTRTSSLLGPERRLPIQYRRGHRTASQRRLASLNLAKAERHE